MYFIRTGVSHSEEEVNLESDKDFSIKLFLQFRMKAMFKSFVNLHFTLAIRCHVSIKQSCKNLNN